MAKRRTKLLLALILPLAWLAPSSLSAHSYHVAMTVITYNPRSSSLEVVHEFFAHDVMSVLSARAGEHLSLDNPRLEAMLEDYLAERVSLSIDDAPLTLTWVGMEVAGDQITSYQEAAVAGPPPRLAVRQAAMIEGFQGQLNTVNIVMGEQIWTERFHDGHEQAVIELN